MIVCSFSGGETSAYLAKILLDEHGPDKTAFIFANTGQENEETLEFIRKYNDLHALGVVWVEADVHQGRVGTTARTVDFATADRAGAPFVDHVKKYGIPNKIRPHCTRELKSRPIKSYLDRMYGKEYVLAIGIRADEAHRLPKKPHPRIIHPLCKSGTTKQDINVFFEHQPFRLNLQEHQGNCKTCWKKSDIKLAAIYEETPEAFDFFAWIERTYGFAGALKTGDPHVFWRQGRTTDQLIQRFSEITPYIDSYRRRLEWGDDDDAGCSESCEPFQEDFGF